MAMHSKKINPHYLSKVLMQRFSLGFTCFFTLLIPASYAGVICPEPSEYRYCFAKDLNWPVIAEHQPELSSQLNKVKREFARNPEDAKRASTAADALSEIKKQLEQNSGVVEQEALDKYLKALSEAIDWYRAAANGNPPKDKTPVNIQNFDLEHGAGSAPKEWLTKQDCWNVTAINGGSKCKDVYPKVLNFGEHVEYIHQVVDGYYVPRRREARDQLKTRESEWHTYLYATQFQYPWELMWNRNQKNTNAKRDEWGNEIGIREAPKGKNILFHPDVGIQYVNGQAKGDRFVPALIFEWYGIQTWSNYTEDGVSGLRGISLVTTVADHRNVSSIGHGLMFHYDNYAVGLTSHSRKLAISLNFKLADRLGKVDKKLADELQQPIKALDAQ